MEDEIRPHRPRSAEISDSPGGGEPEKPGRPQGGHRLSAEAVAAINVESVLPGNIEDGL